MSTDYELFMQRLTEAVFRAVSQVAADYPEANGHDIAEALRLVHKQQVTSVVDQMLAVPVQRQSADRSDGRDPA